MIKLSELENDSMLIFENETLRVISVEDFKEEIEEYREKKIWTADPYPGELNAMHMLEREIEYQCDDNHEDWEEIIRDSIEETDMEELQDILDRILERAGSGNITYTYGEQVEIDL